MKLDSTISAISTPYGTGGISIIRLSGADSIKITDKIFKASSKITLSRANSHTIHHGKIVDENQNILDEVLVSVMKAPKTYTGEDICEINCHGGLMVTKSILDLVLKNGATLADKGEFTKRAFLNGKLDLSKAESVIDVINSKSYLEQQISVNNLGGTLSMQIDEIRNSLVELLANIQVLIDYPDEGLEDFSDEEFLNRLKLSNDKISNLLKNAQSGTLIKEGIPTVIVGKPNVGKSSLLNLLSKEEKAIVTPIAGTTRDTIEEYVNLGDVILKLADTAGIRETSDEIEMIGVKKSLEYIKKSSLIIFMCDAQNPLSSEDYEVINAIKGKKAIALINKQDIGNKISKDELSKYFENVIDFSVKEKKGLDVLENTIKEMFELGKIDTTNNAIITNSRQKDALVKANQSILSAIDAISNGLSVDTTFIDIENAISSLGEITGVSVSEEVIDKIFHNFCIGK